MQKTYRPSLSQTLLLPTYNAQHCNPQALCEDLVGTTQNQRICFWTLSNNSKAIISGWKTRSNPIGPTSNPKERPMRPVVTCFLLELCRYPLNPIHSKVDNIVRDNLAIPSFSWTALLCLTKAQLSDHIYSHEKLGTIGMFPSVCHWQKERSVMFENKVFICLKKKYVCQIFPDKERQSDFLSN